MDMDGGWSVRDGCGGGEEGLIGAVERKVRDVEGAEGC